MPVEANVTTVTNFAYTALAGPRPTGRLQVLLRANTAPDVPLVVSGSGWQLEGTGEIFADGFATNLPTGAHLVTFRNVNGWSTPEPTEVIVSSGPTAQITGYYLPPAGNCPENVALPLPLQTLAALDAAVNPPLRTVGQLRSDAGFGSGVAVRERVVLTAAHVVFDDAQLPPFPPWIGPLAGCAASTNRSRSAPAAGISWPVTPRNGPTTSKSWDSRRGR